MCIPPALAQPFSQTLADNPHPPSQAKPSQSGSLPLLLKMKLLSFGEHNFSYW